MRWRGERLRVSDLHFVMCQDAGRSARARMMVVLNSECVRIRRHRHMAGPLERAVALLPMLRWESGAMGSIGEHRA